MFRRPLILVSMSLALLVAVVSCAPAASPTPAVQTPAATQPKSPTSPASPSPKATPTPASPSPTKKDAEQPLYGGVVTRVMNRDVPNFDVQQGVGADTSATMFNVFQGLVRLDPLEHQKVLPELAEKWEISPDGKTYTFKFYPGIKWHDGKPFTMDDVKYSLDRMHTPKDFKAISPRGEPLLAAMDKAEIAGEDTIKITTKYPSASFLGNLATGWVAIGPKHILVAKGDLKRDAIGTGPFKLKEFSADVTLALEKNKDYYVKGLPYLDGIRFYTVKDTATRFSAFRTGQAKITFTGSAGLSPTESEIVRREMTGKATVYEHDALTGYTLVFNMERKPWSDIRVRRAVNLVFDHQAAIKINGDRGYIGSIFVQPWGMKPEDVAKLPGFRQPKDADVAEAKKLMAEAGFPNGFKTTLLSQTGGATERQATLMKDQLARIGIDAEISLAEYAAYFERSSSGNFDLLNTSNAINTSDPDEMLFTNYVTGGGRNFGRFSVKEIDELINKQAGTLDATVRKAMVADIEKKIMEQIPVVLTFWNIWQTGGWNDVKHFRPGPGIHSYTKYDYMWLAK
ncbi:MAG: ABC transporter substrate-binding protein [Chloroflexota bacterium]